MNLFVILMIVFALLIIGSAILFVITQKKKKQPPNYRAFFILGICWIPAGIAIKNYGLLAAGIIFTVIGLINRKKWRQEKKWSELTPAEKRLKIILLTVVAVLLILGIIVFFIQRNLIT